MIAHELITTEIPSLKHTDSVELALDWMEEFKVTHLVILQEKQYLGIISEELLLNQSDTDLALAELISQLIRPILLKEQHAYDAIKLMSKLSLSVLPVLDTNEEVIGLITQKSVFEKMAGITSAQEPGGIIVLQMPSVDYNLTQIASIVETNEAKILSLNVLSTPEHREIEVTLKINREDLSRILQTFNRYNYTIKAHYHQSQFEDGLLNRYNEFMRIFNI
jgi:acetoin utilization protein AcuB